MVAEWWQEGVSFAKWEGRGEAVIEKIQQKEESWSKKLDTTHLHE